MAFDVSAIRQALQRVDDRIGKQIAGSGVDMHTLGQKMNSGNDHFKFGGGNAFNLAKSPYDVWGGQYKHIRPYGATFSHPEGLEAAYKNAGGLVDNVSAAWSK